MVIEKIYVDGKLIKIEAINPDDSRKPKDVKHDPVEIPGTGIYRVPYIRLGPYVCEKNSVIEFKYETN